MRYGAGRKDRSAAGAFGQFVQTFSDYRNVNGLTLPFKITATFDGQPWKDQSLAVDEITINGAVDPTNGDLLWSHPHKTDFGLNTMTPVWGDDNLLFVSSGYNGGSRVLRLTRGSEGKTTVEEVWFHRLMRVHFGACIRVGDFVYGSSGDFGPAPFTAVNVKTGKIMWRDRGFPRASFVMAEGRFILLDEDGNLALVTPAPEGLKVHAKVALMTNNSWTVPTLAGTTLYLRDRKTILALDLK